MGGKINKGWSDKSNGISFVCHKIPFVCHEPSHSIPIICIYTPSVRNCAFSTGFTLVELLITLTIIGLLATFAAPAMTTFIKGQRISSQTNDFVADLNFAKSEAIKRGGSVVICAAVAGGGTCAAAGTTNYQNGRLIFVDVNGDAAYDAAAGDLILRERPILEGTLNRLQALSGGSPIVFTTRGVATQGAGNYALCDDRGEALGREIQFSGGGQPRVLKKGSSGYSNSCPP